MEHVVGAISEGEWSSLNEMCSDEADFMAQLLGNCSLPNELPNNNSNFPTFIWPTSTHHESNESAMYSSDEANASMHSFSQGSSYYSGGSSVLFHESYYHHHPSASSSQVFMNNNNNNNNNNLMTMDFCMMESCKDETNFLNQDVSNDSLESNENMPEDLQLGRALVKIPMPPRDGKISSPSDSKKRSRVPGEVQKNKRSMKLKKCMNPDDNDDDNKNHNNNAGLHRQTSISGCSEDESNASHELNGMTTSCSGSKANGALNLTGKTRANRGSATDPQSLYARKRRERINERLRILQNLVPNGTKVDISTMLEEAVQYVKFLQLQIKLLSSDDLWMYAPIAYNGMDIGLDLKISTPNPQS